MHDSIGIISCERFCLECYHRLIHFPYDKEIFPKTAVTFHKIEQPLQPLPREPI